MYKVRLAIFAGSLRFSFLSIPDPASLQPLIDRLHQMLRSCSFIRADDLYDCNAMKHR